MKLSLQSPELVEQQDTMRGAPMPPIDQPSWAARAKSAERIAALYCRAGLDPATRRIAEDSFRVLRYDGETVVRRLLAECLKNAAHLPHDVALSLATDKAEVAELFLAHSPALSDHELLAVVRDHPGQHRLAIARRQPLSETLAEALCRCGEPAVALVVVGNDAATITEATLHALLDDTAAPSELHEAIARRKLLPISVGERLLAMTGATRACAPLHSRKAGGGAGR
jgi:uncharacterized protein (DUF2336 family)